MLPVPRAARPLLAVVVVQFGRVSRPGLARRTVGLPASQPGPARRRFHERARDPEAVATCSFAKLPSLLHTPRPLPCGVFMAVCGCRQMQSQAPSFSRLHHSEEEEESCLDRPPLGCSCRPIQPKKRLDFSTTVSPLLAALSKVQVGLVAADAAVRRPSVGLSAASSRPDGGDCGRTTVCCGAGSPPPLHPDGRDCTEKSCAANTDRARVGGRWPRHLTPSCCTLAPTHNPRLTPGPGMTQLCPVSGEERGLCNLCSYGFKGTAPFKCHMTLCTLLSAHLEHLG